VNDRSMKIRLGAFVLVAMVALSALVILFGGSPRFFTSRTKYVVLFPEAPGVGPGTPVRKSGVRIGSVTGLELDEATGQVRLAIEIEGKHLPRTNEEPAIARGLLSGDTTLDFIPKADKDGTLFARGEAYPTGSEIPGVPPLNTTRLLSNATQAVPDAREALSTFTTTVSSFRPVGAKAEKTLDEIAEFIRTAKAIVPEVRETNRRIQEFIGGDVPPASPKGSVAPGQKISTVLQAAPDELQPNNLKTLTKEVQDFVKVLKPLADELRTLVKNNQDDLTKSLKNIAQLSERAGQLLNEENRKAMAAVLKRLDESAADILTKENRDAIAVILKNVKDGSGDLKSALIAVNSVASRAEASLKNLDETLKTGTDAFKTIGTAVKKIESRVDDVQAIFDDIKKVTKPLGESAGPMIKSITKAADELGVTIADARQIIALLTKDQGTLGKIVNDPALYNQLVEAATNLSRTMMRAEKIARDLEIFADKVARKPESIGLGGAIRPSIGLKESPFAPLPKDTLQPRPISPVPGGTLQEPTRLEPSFPIAPLTAEGTNRLGPLAPIPPTRSNLLGEGK